MIRLFKRGAWLVALSVGLGPFPAGALTDPSAADGPTSVLGLASATASVPWTSYAASAVVPGAGQWLEGRRETALAHGSVALVTALLGLYGADQAARPNEPTSGGGNLRFAAAVLLTGLAIWSPLELWWASRVPAASGAPGEPRQEVPPSTP